MPAPGFDVMFTPGGRYPLNEGGTLVAAVEYAGELIAPTGRIAVADPMVCLDGSPDFSMVFAAAGPGAARMGCAYLDRITRRAAHRAGCRR